MRRYWLSWWDTDPRPTSQPPPEWVLGYWTTGQREDELAEWSVCALIEAESEDDAWMRVALEWHVCERRFCREVDERFRANEVRFPLSDWMRERLEVRDA